MSDIYQTVLFTAHITSQRYEFILQKPNLSTKKSTLIFTHKAKLNGIIRNEITRRLGRVREIKEVREIGKDGYPLIEDKIPKRETDLLR